MADTHTGTCFCGALEIKVTGAPLEMGYCHCSSCRSYSGGPVSAYMLWRTEQVEVARGAELLGRFQKTEISDRQYCTRCGGHVLTRHPGMGLTDVRAGIISGIAFQPTVHLNYAESVLPIKDGIAKLRDFPTEAGGSGELLPE